MIIRVKMINAFSKSMSCPTRVNNIYDLLLAQTEKKKPLKKNLKIHFIVWDAANYLTPVCE